MESEFDSAQSVKVLDPRWGYTGIPDDQLDAVAPFEAKVERRVPCAAYLRTSDGIKVSIGNPGSGEDVARFVSTLKIGESYELPKAFIDFRKRRAEAHEED